MDPTASASILLHSAVSLTLRARRVAELAALRLALPSLLAKQPLDELLASLTPSSDRERRAAPGQPLNRTDLLRTERAVARVPWVSSTCLYRALARYALLRRTGVDAAFVMAVDTRGIAENGHAWVELDGRPFEESEDLSHYTVTFRYPPRRSHDRTESL
jgi:Transglutaminase-like superfamily